MNQDFLLALCKRHQAQLLEITDDRVRIAVTGSPDANLLNALRFATHRQIDIECWTAEQLEKHQHQQQSAYDVTDENTSAGVETARLRYPYRAGGGCFPGTAAH